MKFGSTMFMLILVSFHSLKLWSRQ